MSENEHSPAAEVDVDNEGLYRLDQLSGYRDENQYLATKFQQGGRDVYCIDLSVAQLVHTLAKPDPTRHLDGNRKIDEKHATDFAAYVRENRNWIIPPLLLRAPDDIFTFEVLKEMKGTEWGILTVPQLARDDLKIVDGQHRILGFYTAIEQISTDLSDARGTAARKNAKPGAKKKSEIDAQRFIEQRERLDRERVSVQIVIVADPDEFKQMFVDIARNAKGITQSTTRNFDRRDVVNRCLDSVMQHSLLKERIDVDRDRILGGNEYLMGVKHVADLVRTVQVGVAGRITKRRQSDFSEKKLIEDATLFLDTLSEGFDNFADVENGSLTPPELRKRSLLGSVVMQRMLAGVYHDLLINPETNQVASSHGGSYTRNRSEVVRFFQSLSPHMAAPVGADSIWVKHTGQFDEGISAPRFRAQDLKELTTTVRNWAIEPPEWLRPTVRGMAT